MKKVFGLVLLISFCISASSQELRTKEFYYQLSKKQKKGAWIITGSGVVLGIIGLSMINNTDSDDPDLRSRGTKIFTTGCIATVTGLIFFRSSSRNKLRARDTTGSIEMRTVPLMDFATKNTIYPSLTFKIQI